MLLNETGKYQRAAQISALRVITERAMQLVKPSQSEDVCKQVLTNSLMQYRFCFFVEFLRIYSYLFILSRNMSISLPKFSCTILCIFKTKLKIGGLTFIFSSQAHLAAAHWMDSCTTTRMYGNPSPARSASATVEPSCAMR